MKKLSPLLLMVLAAALVFQAGFAVYANVIQENIDISQVVIDKIKAFDPENVEKNLSNYKQLLQSFNVHEQVKQELERLIMEDYALPDLLIAYSFLYQHYGTLADLSEFVQQKASGLAWTDIFTAYSSGKETFIPRAFDSAKLEEMMGNPKLTSDDIMIADLVSFYTDYSFDELIEIKPSTVQWDELLADIGFLFNAEALPRVQITSDQLSKYTRQGGLTEDQVAAAFVIAQKIGREAEVVIEKIKLGYTEEAIFSESYIEQYN
jgi:hypothetical protein